MPPKQKHRIPIIDAAVTLFRQYGYAATGLNDIVDLSQAPKGSLYHYFPDGKSSIATAAVEEAGQRVCRTLTELAEQTPDTPTLLEEHAKLLAQWMKKSGFRDGCPMTTVLLELAPDDRPVTQAGKQAYESRRAILQDKLVADGHPHDAAERLATLCTSAIQGALIEARVRRSGAPIHTVAEELGSLLRVPA